jgi:hypothetical protein
MCLAGAACEWQVAPTGLLQAVQRPTAFTTFPVDAALQRSIHRPERHGENGKKCLLFEVFSAILEKCQVEPC